jgi:hypothetical protein
MQVNGIRHVPARGRRRIPRPDRVLPPGEIAVGIQPVITGYFLTALHRRSP